MFIFKFTIVFTTCLTIKLTLGQFNLLSVPRPNRDPNKPAKINSPSSILRIQVGPKVKITNESISNLSTNKVSSTTISRLSDFSSPTDHKKNLKRESMNKQDRDEAPVTDVTNELLASESTESSNLSDLQKANKSNDQPIHNSIVPGTNRTGRWGIGGFDKLGENVLKPNFPNSENLQSVGDRLKPKFPSFGGSDMNPIGVPGVSNLGEFANNSFNKFKDLPIVSEFLQVASHFKVKSLQGALDYMTKYGHLETPLDITKPADVLNLKDAFKRFQKFFGLTQSGLFDQQTLNLMNEPRCGLPDRETKLTKFVGKLTGGMGLIRRKRYELNSVKYENRNLTWSVNEFSKKALKNQNEKVLEVIKKAFQVWANVTNLQFEFKENTNKTDIVIGFYSLAHGNPKWEPPFDGPNGTLAHTSYPTEQDLHLDDDEKWSLYPENDHTDLFSISIHEIGHKLGLQHTDVQSACLYPIYNSKSTRLDPDDINGIQSLYGAKYDKKEKEKEIVDETATEKPDEEKDDPADRRPDESKLPTIENRPDTTRPSDNRPNTRPNSRPDDQPISEHKKPIRILDFNPERNINSRKELNELASTPCRDLKIDSSVCLRNNKCLIIAGDRNFWMNGKLDLIERKKELNQNLLKGLTGKIDAIYRDNDLIHVIQGRNVTSYNSFYALPVNRTTLDNHFPGFPKHVKHVSSVFKKLSTGVVYIYSGELYWRFTKKYGLEKLPRLTFIFGLPGNIKSVLHFNNGRSVYIKNQNYWVFDESRNDLLSFLPGNLADLNMCKNEEFNINKINPISLITG